jgi:hypothetical protein
VAFTSAPIPLAPAAAPAASSFSSAATAPAAAEGVWVLGAWGVPTYVAPDPPPSPPQMAAPAAAPAVAAAPCPGLCQGGTADALGTCTPSGPVRTAQVPLPMSLALIAGGLMGAAGLRWVHRPGR